MKLGRIADDPVPARKAAAEPEPLIKPPTKIEMWRTSDGRTHTNQGDANRAEVKLAFEKLVKPSGHGGYRHDQPIPLPIGILDRDQLFGWFQDHGHKLFPWLGVYVATVPEPRQGIAVEERS